MVFKWKEEHTSVFLTLFQNHECLWNNKCEAYKIKNKREQALENIVKELNLQLLTTEDIKSKIKTIRTRYASELTKVIKSEKKRGAGSEDIYVPKLYWYKQADAFLRRVCVPRISTSTEIPTRDDEEVGEWNISERHDCDTANALVQNLEEEIHLQSNKDHRNPTKFFKIPVRKRTAFQRIDRAIDKLRKISEENNVEKENEFDIFCKSLALQLKNMPLERALICQQRLQNVMTEERMYQCRMQHIEVQVEENSPS